MTTRLIGVDGATTPSSPASMSASSWADLSRESLASPRKSTLVRMGTRVSSDALVREKFRLSLDPPTTTTTGAYVVGERLFLVDIFVVVVFVVGNRPDRSAVVESVFGTWQTLGSTNQAIRGTTTLCRLLECHHVEFIPSNYGCCPIHGRCLSTDRPNR